MLDVPGYCTLASLPDLLKEVTGLQTMQDPPMAPASPPAKPSSNDVFSGDGITDFYHWLATEHTGLLLINGDWLMSLPDNEQLQYLRLLSYLNYRQCGSTDQELLLATPSSMADIQSYVAMFGPQQTQRSGDVVHSELDQGVWGQITQWVFGKDTGGGAGSSADGQKCKGGADEADGSRQPGDQGGAGGSGGTAAPSAESSSGTTSNTCIAHKMHPEHWVPLDTRWTATCYRPDLPPPDERFTVNLY